MYDKADFNDKAKYGILRKENMEHGRLSVFLLLKESICYEALKRAITNHECSWQWFVIKFAFEDTLPATSKAGGEKMCSDDNWNEARLGNKLHPFSETFPSLILIALRKKT